MYMNRVLGGFSLSSDPPDPIANFSQQLRGDRFKLSSMSLQKDDWLRVLQSIEGPSQYIELSALHIDFHHVGSTESALPHSSISPHTADWDLRDRDTTLPQ